MIRNVRVLIADDAALIRSLLRRSLQAAGSFEVVGEAADGGQAVALAAETDPDVVLMDLSMPVLDGMAAIPEIRRRCPRTKVVVLSAFDGSTPDGTALEAGAAACLSKGSRPDQIVATLRHVTAEPSDEGADRVPVVMTHAPAGPPPAPLPEGSDAPAPPSRRDLLSLLNHDAGNQLAVIQGFAELLVDEVDSLDRDNIRRFADAIVRNALQMRELLDTVSDARKVESGRVQLSVVPTDMARLVREVVGELHEPLSGREVTLNLPDEAALGADPARVRQILIALLTNAAQFTPAGSAVTIDVTALDDVEVRVTDEGPGIPADQAEEVFEKCTRLQTDVQGRGLGLFVARGLARAHGGDLGLGPSGAGCRFILRLPRRAADPMAQSLAVEVGP